MTTLAFILTMPGVGSWNGHWSGEGKLYALTKQVTPQTAARLKNRSWRYSWSDGRAASVECRLVAGQEIRKLKKESRGFCGYEWMVDSILVRDCIKANHEIKEEVSV